MFCLVCIYCAWIFYSGTGQIPSEFLSSPAAFSPGNGEWGYQLLMSHSVLGAFHCVSADAERSRFGFLQKVGINRFKTNHQSSDQLLI